jgi:hypothetical protein
MVLNQLSKAEKVNKKEDYSGQFMLVDKVSGEPLTEDFIYAIEYDDEFHVDVCEEGGCTENVCTSSETKLKLVGIIQRKPFIRKGD